jgi:hypothetical protein
MSKPFRSVPQRDWLGSVDQVDQALDNGGFGTAWL